MTHPGLTPGTLVRSVAGRDLGHCYVVTTVLDHRRVLVADGRVRTVNRPKPKNLRHLEALPHQSMVLHERFARGQRVRDEEVRQTLASCGYNAHKEGGHGGEALPGDLRRAAQFGTGAE